MLCGFGSESNIVSIEALSECDPLDSTDTLQLLQSLRQTAQQAQAQAQQQAQQQQQLQQQAEQVQQQVDQLQQAQQAQQGEEHKGQGSGTGGPSSSASCAASRRSGSPPPRVQDSAPRVAAGGVDGQLTHQMMSERMSDLYNWVVSWAACNRPAIDWAWAAAPASNAASKLQPRRSSLRCSLRALLPLQLRESSNLKYSMVPREQLPPATAGYGLRTDWVLRGHAGAVDLASCHADCIATASFDGTAKLWRVPVLV